MKLTKNHRKSMYSKFDKIANTCSHDKCFYFQERSHMTPSKNYKLNKSQGSSITQAKQSRNL